MRVAATTIDHASLPPTASVVLPTSTPARSDGGRVDNASRGGYPGALLLTVTSSRHFTPPIDSSAPAFPARDRRRRLSCYAIMANAIVGTDIPPGVLTDDEARSLAAQLLKVVGARVREIRHSQGLSLNDVRDNLGIDASHISRMENGKMNLSPRALVRLAFIFIVRPWDFYLPDEKMRGFRPKRQTSPMPSKEALAEARTLYQQQIGARIRALRELQGISHDGLEAVSGVGISTLPKLERGRAALTTVTAVRIADGLGVHPRELYIPAEQSDIRMKRRRR